MNENNMYDIKIIKPVPEFILFCDAIIRKSLINEFTIDLTDNGEREFWVVTARNRDKITLYREGYETEEEAKARFNELVELLC